MGTLTLILMLVAVGCFVIATFGLVARVNWVAAGLAAWALAVLIPTL